MACAMAVPTSAADDTMMAARTSRPPSRAGHISRPAPVDAALNLLHWSRDEVPEIEVVAVRPPSVNVLAEGWTVRNADGTAQPTIYVAGWSELYRHALENPGNHHNMIRLAGVLAHERVHLRHGPDEERAYAEQLTTLERLRAEPIEVTNVHRALDAVRALRPPNLAKPIARAVMLLGWSDHDVPRVEVVDKRPSDASPTVEAWIRYDPNGQPIPIIYILSNTEVYRDAVGTDYQALVRLAGMLVHERWHLRYGPDEKGAYSAQLSAMEYLHANTMHLAVVRRARDYVSKATKTPSRGE
jgi:hypothetical protein